MHPALQRIWDEAKAQPRRIVLPEGEDDRVIRAGAALVGERLAHPVLIGRPDAIRGRARDLGVSLDGIELISPDGVPELDQYAGELYALRQRAGMTHEEAATKVRQPLYLGAFLVRKGVVDGFVGGTANTTADTVRAGLHVVGIDEQMKTITSFFLMLLPDRSMGEDGAFLFGDCALIPDPSPRQLAHIAVNVGRAARDLFGWTPRVAMLSFSTKGSGQHPMVDKVVKATEQLRQDAPDLDVEGEIQADAALVPEVAALKFKGAPSPVAGKANVLIFPDLNAANIGYKLVQRLARAEAIGPVIQGFRKPVNDMSRGCTAEDIVSVCAFTVVQAKTAQTAGAGIGGAFSPASAK